MPSWDVNFNVRVRYGDPEVAQLTAQVDALASVIRGIPIAPSVQQRLNRLNIIRAVRGTTGIEGTEFSEAEIEEILASPPSEMTLPQTRRREEQEVRNAEALMLDVAKRLQRAPHFPLTEQLIRNFHAILTREISYEHNEPGRYRSHRVTVGPYVPPETGDDVRRLMREFVEWFNTGERTHWNPVVRAIAAHFYVVSIHPFGDGNGRTSRAVESYLLYQAGVNARGFYSLANYYYEHRAEYVRHLGLVQFGRTDDLTPFIVFALRGLVEELKSVHEEILAEVRLIAFRDYARQTLSSDGSLGARGERVLNFIVDLGAQRVAMADLRNQRHPIARFYRNLTNRTMARDIKFMEELGLVMVENNHLRANLEVMNRRTCLV